jgi:hypothetical protein
MTNPETFWNKQILNIPKPPSEKTIWGNKHSRLSLMIVEPRMHKWLKGVLYNMSHIYGGTSAQLYIFHGKANSGYVKEIIKDWKNVNLINIHVDNLQPHPYAHSKFCLDPSLWETFNSEFVLTMTTTSLLRRRVDNHFFSYSYVGAPWNGPAEGPESVGNGGFSLRKNKDIIQACKNIDFENSYKTSRVLEDTLISRELLRLKKNIPFKKEALKFSVETVYGEDPVGCHAPYRYFDTDILKKLHKINYDY